MKCCDVDKDGFYIVECPLGTRTVWRRETGESWDTGASEPRIMWFDCSDASSMPMEAIFNPQVETVRVLGRLQIKPGLEPVIERFVT